MEQYIPKSALVAKIEKLMNRYDSEYDKDSTEVNAAKGNVCHEILCTIDTLEVKEVDSDEIKIGETQIYIEDDGGEPPYDGKQWLDLECLEYEISKDKFKDGDKVEIVLRKIQKGE